MTKLYTAFSREMDDPEVAVPQICAQLDLEKNMLKNTVGIVHFCYEFVDTGVLQAIADALPFELAGCVSSYTAIGGVYGDAAISVTMITSDDDDFSIHVMEGIGGKSAEQIESEITQLFTALAENKQTKMVLPFMVPLQHFSGDALVACVNALPMPLPIFGTLAYNLDSIDGTNYVMGNGKISDDIFAFVAFSGGMEPKFHVTTALAYDDDFGETGNITEASGPVLKAVNGMPALSYLKKRGMIASDNSVVGSGMWAVPAILTYPNGTKTVRAFLGVVEGTESIFATGSMEAGAQIKFAYLDGDKTIASAEKLIQTLTESKQNDIIAYSCAARAWSLGASYFAETQKISECADEYLRVNGEPLNYNLAYSGGEICPVIDNDGKLINMLHNYTLIACTFS